MKKCCSCLLSVLFALNTSAQNAHLIPVRDNFGIFPPEGPIFAKVYEEVLFKDVGWLVRYYEVTESPSATLAISIYKNKGEFFLSAARSEPDLYSVLIRSFARHVDVREAVKTAHMRHVVCPMPESTARQVSLLWLALLKQTSQAKPGGREYAPIFQAILYARDPSGRPLRGQVPPDAANYAEFRMLDDVLDNLVRCPNAQGAARTKLLREIESSSRKLRLKL